jgi:dCTP deaminase
VILTGEEILREVAAKRIVISPLDPERIEPNSYGFRLAEEVIEYESPVLDPREELLTRERIIPPEGLVFEPDRCYLCGTVERMGSDHYAATLYANRSVGTLGMWIQISAPLGHTGAIIPWTLEVKVAAPVRVYAGMLIGKIAFWRPKGEILEYEGKYTGSTSAVKSRITEEMVARSETGS